MPEPAPLADGVVDDAVVAAEHAAVEMRRCRRPGGVRLQPLDDVGVAALRHEADVLAVGLVGDGSPICARERAHLGLGQAAEREAQIVELLRVVAKRK